MTPGIAQDPKEISDDFCKCLINQENDCVEQLYAHFKGLWNSKEMRETMSGQFVKLHEARDLIGDLKSFELISDRNQGDTFRGLIYALKYDRQPYRITLIFYKASEKWTLFNMKLDDQMDVDFERQLQE